MYLIELEVKKFRIGVIFNLVKSLKDMNVPKNNSGMPNNENSKNNLAKWHRLPVLGSTTKTTLFSKDLKGKLNKLRRQIFGITGPVSYTHLTLPTNREV